MRLQDHLNDVVSNALSVVAIVLATRVKTLWFFDPLFAILLACFIVFNWSLTGRGKGGPQAAASKHWQSRGAHWLAQSH